MGIVDQILEIVDSSSEKGIVTKSDVVDLILKIVNERDDRSQIISDISVYVANEILKQNLDIANYKPMFGTNVKVNPKEYPNIKYKSIDFLPYSRAQIGVSVFLIGKDDEKDLCTLLVKKRGAKDHQAVSGFFKAVPPAVLSDEERLNYDKDLEGNALRELKEELGIDLANSYQNLKLQYLGTHVHSENPKGNDMVTAATVFAVDFTKEKKLPLILHGMFNDCEPDPEAPFDSIKWAKIKDMKVDKDNKTIDFGMGIISRDMTFEYVNKAVKQYYDNLAIQSTLINLDSLMRLQNTKIYDDIYVGKDALKNLDNIIKGGMLLSKKLCKRVRDE